MESRTRLRIQVRDPLAPVRVSPVRVNGSAVTNTAIEILDDEGAWQCLNIHSASYQLVPNEQVEQVTRAILDDTGMRWEPSGEVWSGRYWARMLKSDVAMKVPQVGDALKLGLRVENSYDGSCQFRLVLMAYVLSCANGLVSPRCFSTYRMRHTRSNEFSIDEAVSVIQAGMDELTGIIPVVERLSEIPLTMELLSQVAKDTELPNGEWGHITKELTEATSAWDLMQAITHRLTHYGRGRSSLQHQERVGDYFLHELAA